MNENLQLLKQQLVSQDRNIRSQAVLELGNLTDPDSLAWLVDMVGVEEDLFVREDITWALVKFQDVAIDPLIELLKNGMFEQRHHAAHTLGKIGNPRALNALLNALDDPEHLVLSKAIFVLSQVGDARAVPALIKLIGRPEADLQTTVNFALKRFEAESIPYLMELAHHENDAVREQVVDILGLIGSAESIPALLDALNDPSWKVRFAAVTALSEYQDETLVDNLEPLTHDPEPRVQTLVNLVLNKTSR